MSNTPSPLTKTQIVALAKKIRSQYPSNNSQELLDNIRKDKNIETEYCSDDTREESLVIDSEGATIIYLPHNSSPARDRFTIAHELGHFFLHHNSQLCPKEGFTRRGSDRLEWQANWFAAELLMPEDTFLAEAERCNRDEETLSRIFGVSKSAASVRLKSLSS